LLLGQDVELFTYDLPKLYFILGYDQYFPIVGPLGARLGGSIEASADFAFGFDTFGLRQYVNTGNEGDIFKGFYVSDTVNADGTGDDVSEITLKGALEASAELNVVVASAGVGGGIYGNIDFDLNDRDPKDGKIRIDELTPLNCLFDISGELSAGLNAYVSLGIKPFRIRKRFDIARVVLASFESEASCGKDDENPIPPPILATLTNGVLQLDTGVEDDFFQVSHQSGAVGSETIQVSTSAATQNYGPITQIEANGEVGNDLIELTSGVLSPATLTGGDGDDILIGGGGDDAARRWFRCRLPRRWSRQRYHPRQRRRGLADWRCGCRCARRCRWGMTPPAMKPPRLAFYLTLTISANLQEMPQETPSSSLSNTQAPSLTTFHRRSERQRFQRRWWQRFSEGCRGQRYPGRRRWQ
jgi:hypothetical protein